MANCEQIRFEDEMFQIVINTFHKSEIWDMERAQRSLHEAIEIKYFVEGTTTLLIGSKTVVAKPGDIVVINPYEIHATVAYEGNETSKYHIIMVSPDFFFGMGAGAPDLRYLLLAHGIHFRNMFQQDKRLAQIIEHIVKESTEKREGYRYVVRGLMLELFALLLRDGIQLDAVSIPQKNAIRYYNTVDPALCKIRNEYSGHISVDELAALCGVSKYHFCRIFKYVTGMSTMQYLTEYRLKIAEAMLINSDKSVSQVAQQCGFEDESYFCRCYKKHFHHPPGKYRQRTKEL